MNNLISDIVIDSSFKTFEVITVNDIELCSLFPPLIINTITSEIIGYSIQTTNNKNYRIFFLNDNVSDFDILIKENTAHTLDSINNSDFSKSFTRIFSQLNFIFPPEIDLIDFKNGLYIQIEISECISYTILPLSISTITMSDQILTSKDIYYDSVSNQFIFNRIFGNNSTHFFIRLIPSPILNNIYSITTSNSLYYLDPPQTFNYTTLSANVPITLSNTGFTFDNINTYTSSIICLHKKVNKILKIKPISSVCNFTFTLNNENTLFEIDNEGNLTKINDTITLDNIYYLNITIEDSFGETIIVIVKVTFFDIYVCKDICSRRCLNIAYIPCLPIGNSSKFILHNSNVDNLLTVGNMISHTVDFIIQTSIMINYRNVHQDPTVLLDILYEGTELEFGLYYENRLNSSNTNVLCKLDLLVENLFPFFKKYIESIINKSELKCEYKRTPFGDIIIRKL